MEKSVANHNANRIWIVVSVLLLLALFIYIWIHPPGTAGDDKVATINGVDISKEDFYQALVAAGGTSTLDTMIRNELVNQEAKKAGVQVTQEDIAKELETVKSNFSSDDEFQYALSMYGLTEDSLKSDIELNVKISKLLEPQISITEEELQAYYDENIDSLKTPESVNASHIVVATKEEAESIRTSLINGADFKAIAKEKSLDENTKENGGELGLIYRGYQEETFDTAAFSLELGKLSEIVETSEGFHIIKISERISEVIPTFEELKEQITDDLTNSKIQELSSTWINDIYAAAEIETFLD